MNVGEKIRSLRVAKMMTQSELAGTEITRNMISCIENGTAQPSLSTVVYLAGRLGVPVGFLLAEEGDEFLWRKMNAMPNVKRAFREEDWNSCRTLCLAVSRTPDDELCMILARSDVGIAIEAFESGKLHTACRYFDEALDFAARTIYSQPQIEAVAEVYFRYLRRISPTLFSENGAGDRRVEVTLQTPFAAYVDALDALDANDPGPAGRFLQTYAHTPFYASHIRVKLHLANREYEEAKALLQGLLNAPAPLLNEVQLWAVLSDLEIACRETDDYKGAYQYANERVQLHEQLLKDGI